MEYNPGLPFLKVSFDINRDKKIAKMRAQGMTYSEIAAVIGVSKARIPQILYRAWYRAINSAAGRRRRAEHRA